MKDTIPDFLARVYSPDNNDSAPEKLRQAEVKSNEALYLPEDQK